MKGSVKGFDMLQQKRILEDEDVVRNKKTYRHYIYRDGLFYTEFGQYASNVDLENCEYVPFRPKLEEGMNFSLLSNSLKQFHCAIFELDCGWRFRVFVDNSCRFKIPFWFRTKDSRIEWAQAEWHCNSSRIQTHMKKAAYMCITYDKKTPELYIDNFTSNLTVPSMRRRSA